MKKPKKEPTIEERISELEKILKNFYAKKIMHLEIKTSNLEEELEKLKKK